MKARTQLTNNENRKWTNMKLQSIAGIVFALMLVVASSGYAQQKAGVLFQSGLYQEEVKGDLDAAIKVYERIIINFPKNRPVAAKALLHIGLCKEKLGRNEAINAYQKVVELYPEQQEEVATAKERIAELSRALEKVALKPTFRKIRIPTGISDSARLSPDGQKVILSSKDDKLWIMPLSGKLGPEFPGAPVRLNTGDVKVDRQAGLAWSGDGKWIAFSELSTKDQEGKQSIYIVSAKGRKPKKVYENYRDARIINYRMSLSPHGKILAFSSVDLERKEQHIYTIPVDEDSPKKLVDAQAREPVFSPDGKMIAYVEDKNLGIGGGGLWTVPADGGTPTLVAKAGNASSPIWSPDGRMIAFLDYKKGRHVYIIPIGKGGKYPGEMITIDAPEGIEEVRLLAGWIPDNKIGAITISQQEFALYTLPEKGGKATIIAHGGYPVQPRWSPDGKRIFHTNKLDDGSGDWKRLALASVPAEGGEVTTIPIQSDDKIIKPAWGGGNRVSPDGKTIVFAGQKSQEEIYIMHIWTLPVEGGRPEQLTNAPVPLTDRFPCWSPDGKAIAFVRTKKFENYYKGFSETNIYILKMNDREPKPLTSASDKVNFGTIAWSPDGKLMAYFSRDGETEPEVTLKVIPVDGGVSRVVGKVQGAGVHTELAWSPDSKRIAFNGTDNKTIKVISINDGSFLDIKTGLADPYIYHLDWSPDGNKFVFCGATGGYREFWLMENFLPESKAGE
jgi:Tol biopolymer transport system component